MGDSRYQELLGIGATSDQPTYYELLEVPTGAPSLEAIDKAFREKMKKLQAQHSPKHKGFIEFLKEELRRAKLTLESEERRGEYDAALRERRLEAVKELLEPVLALGQLTPEAIETLVKGIAQKQGLDPADARALVDELCVDEGAPADQPERDMGRTIVTRKLRSRSERRAPAEVTLGALLSALRQGEAAFARAWPVAVLIEDERGLLARPNPELAKRPEVLEIPVFPLRRKGGGAGEVSLGRAAGSDVRLEAPSVSSRHAVLRPPRVPGAPWTVSDLVSTNGTVIDGKRIPSGREIPLPPMARVTFGAYRPLLFLSRERALTLLRVIIGSQPPATPPAPARPTAAPAQRPPAPGPVRRPAPSARRPVGPPPRGSGPRGRPGTR